ncbi:putative lipoate-protein ligase [Staphylococcus aureus]|nr:putative lipoate-protein ligase [Staphylococcus aureus]
MKDIEDALIGVQHQKEFIVKALQDIDVYHYFGDIKKEEIINLML